jgi:hypothetical protein
VTYAIAVQEARAGFGLNEGNHHRYTISENGITLPAYMWKIDRSVDFAVVKDRWKERWESLILQTETNNQLSIAEKLRIPQIQELVGHLLIDILQHLHAINEKSLANSVWQSIRVDALRSAPNSSEDITDTHKNDDYWLPDDVTELLANEKLCTNLWPALQFDQIHDGNISQFWLIDRIMQHGSIWAGNYIIPSQPARTHPTTSPTAPTSPNPETSNDQNRGSILQTQLTRQLLAMKAHEVTAADPDRKPEDVTIMVAAFLTLADLSIEDTDERDRRLSARASAFDVDGPCLVATPFDSEMEKLPRPSSRTMSCAWVVEAEAMGGALNTDETAGQARGQFRVLDRVKGAWEIMEQTMHAYTFV